MEWVRHRRSVPIGIRLLPLSASRSFRASSVWRRDYGLRIWSTRLDTCSLKLDEQCRGPTYSCLRATHPATLQIPQVASPSDDHHASTAVRRSSSGSSDVLRIPPRHLSHRMPARPHHQHPAERQHSHKDQPPHLWDGGQQRRHRTLASPSSAAGWGFSPQQVLHQRSDAGGHRSPSGLDGSTLGGIGIPL